MNGELVNPYGVVNEFERALTSYTGAPYAVAVSSCTAAITLAVAWHVAQLQADADRRAKADGLGMRLRALPPPVELPSRTYVSVPMAVMRAGCRVTFRDYDWLGRYRLNPFPVYDSARHFTSRMYSPMVQADHGFVCLSFHASKTLGIEYGGAILHDNPKADAWFRRARFHGRSEGVAPKDDTFDMLGFDCRMPPSLAAQGILRLYSLPRNNDPLPNDEYADLSTMEIFK